MSLEARSSSALFKRAEQLKRWEEWEKSSDSPVVTDKHRKIKFSSGCVFLAACAAGDKEEVLRLIENGADIDTANVDGLTALHQACIDDNLDMVEFLVEHGADVNRGDNEGWTPLHATASCGFISIANIDGCLDIDCIVRHCKLLHTSHIKLFHICFDVFFRSIIRRHQSRCGNIEQLAIPNNTVNIQTTVNTENTTGWGNLYLIEHGADVAAVNNDGELPVDISESDEMEDMLQQHIDDRGIDCEDARNEEERLMLNDAKDWLSSGEIEDRPHPKTGATALHVAAAKGYIKVMEILVQAGVDVNTQDFDGWTPLHAAAHWGQRDACEILVENFCDMDKKNYVGQTSFDVADTEMIRTLEELKKKQSAMQRDKGDINALFNKKPQPKRRSSVTRMSGMEKTNLAKEAWERDRLSDDMCESSSIDTVPQVVLQIQPELTIPHTENSRIGEAASHESDDNDNEEEEDDDDDISSSISDKSSCSSESSVGDGGGEKKNRANKDEPTRIAPLELTKSVPVTAPTLQPKQSVVENDDSTPSWRRPGSFRNRGDISNKNLTLRIGEKENQTVKVTSPTGPITHNATDQSQEVVLRRTQSFEADEKFYRRYWELRAKINAGNSCPALHASPVAPTHSASLPIRSASLKEKHFTRRGLTREEIKAVNPSGLPHSYHVTTADTAATTVNTTTITTTPVSTNTTSVTTLPPVSPNPQHANVRSGAKAVIVSSPVQALSTPTTPGGSKLSPGNIFKNFFKSFVPPVRDEESETQRKAHAKRVRETRRSTQGVTLEEIKSAEQLVKRKQQQQLHQATQQLNNNEVPSVMDEPLSVTATITTEPPLPTGERRPSWRLRVDSGSKFMLEDARATPAPAEINRQSATVPETVRRIMPVTTHSPPSSSLVDTADTTVTIALRRQNKTPDEQDKENDIRNVQATQAVIQRRRRPKRRSTGVVHVDMEEIDPEKQDVGKESENEDVNSSESSGDKSGRSSRLSSTGSTDAVENGEIDYKKLYEESMLENERLREKLKRTEEDLNDARNMADKSVTSGKSSMSETEKRERRAMERKLSEMEEELKQLQKLKLENERLRAENRALTRVVSKLTASANAGK